MNFKQRGFNLIELMIALVIGLVLMMSVTTMFVDTKVTANRSATVSSLQQQAQLALQVLVEDVRSIGSWAEFSGESLSDIKKPLIPQVAGSCSIIPVSGAVATMNLPADASWVVNTGTVPDAVINEANCVTQAGYSIAKDSDVLSIARILGSIVAVGGMNNSDYYVAVTPQQAQLFKASTPNGATSIDNAEIYPYIHHTYFIEAHETEGTRLSRFSLQDSQLINDLIVGNIERIRIEFGVDSNANGIADIYYASSDASFSADMWNNNQIVTARIYVLARATNMDATFNNTKVYNLGSDQFDPPDDDHYRRFLLSTTVVIRNNVMAVTQ